MNTILLEQKKKHLYRNLVSEFHPDTSTLPLSEKQKTEITKQINEIKDDANQLFDFAVYLADKFHITSFQNLLLSVDPSLRFSAEAMDEPLHVVKENFIFNNNHIDYCKLLKVSTKHHYGFGRGHYITGGTKVPTLLS